MTFDFSVSLIFCSWLLKQNFALDRLSTFFQVTFKNLSILDFDEFGYVFHGLNRIDSELYATIKVLHVEVSFKLLYLAYNSIGYASYTSYKVV